MPRLELPFFAADLYAVRKHSRSYAPFMVQQFLPRALNVSLGPFFAVIAKDDQAEPSILRERPAL